MVVGRRAVHALLERTCVHPPAACERWRHLPLGCDRDVPTQTTGDSCFAESNPAPNDVDSCMHGRHLTASTTYRYRSRFAFTALGAVPTRCKVPTAPAALRLAKRSEYSLRVGREFLECARIGACPYPMRAMVRYVGL